MTLRALTLAALALVFVAGGRLGAQTALAQLGLTDAAARTFLSEEMKRPAANRQSDIAVAGTRAFLKLPSSARGAAATALFAWAKSYVGAPAFTTIYATHRRESIPQEREYDLSVEQQVKKDVDRQLADLQVSRKAIAALPPQDRAAILEQVNENERRLKSPEFVKQLQAQLAEERAQTRGQDAD